VGGIVEGHGSRCQRIVPSRHASAMMMTCMIDHSPLMVERVLVEAWPIR
jgi:hypothetical protein